MKGGSEVISGVGILPGALEAYVELERTRLNEHEHMCVNMSEYAHVCLHAYEYCVQV